MYKYKLKDEYIQDGERVFIGFGTTKEGIISSATPIESPLLELIEGQEPVPAQPVQAVTAPQTIAPVQPTQPPAPAVQQESN